MATAKAKLFSRHIINKQCTSAVLLVVVCGSCMVQWLSGKRSTLSSISSGIPLDARGQGSLGFVTPHTTIYLLSNAPLKVHLK